MTTDSTGTGSPATGPTNGIRSASAAFENFLTLQEEGTQDEEKANEAGDEPVAQDSAEEEPAEAEAAEESTDEQGAEPAAEEVQTFTVMVDGKEEKVPLDELLQGYSRTSDYTRKTQALAEQRKQFLEESAGVREERAEYGKLLPKLRASLEAGMGPEPDWSTLRREDPARAAVLWQMREEQRRSLEGLKQEEQRTQQRLAAEEAAAAEERAQLERNHLLEKVPSWRDPKVASDEAALIRKLMLDVGFPDEEVSLTDHRHVVIALKAAKYDQMMAKKPQLDKQIAKAPVVKPGAPAKPKSPATQDLNRLRRSGSVRDAASVFANFIND